MAFNPALSTDRDALRWFLNDTNDASPAFGLDEAGYDAVIARFGLRGAAIALIDKRIEELGPNMVVDGDRTDMTNSLYAFWMKKREDVMNGLLLPGGNTTAGASIGVRKMEKPDEPYLRTVDL